MSVDIGDLPTRADATVQLAVDSVAHGNRQAPATIAAAINQGDITRGWRVSASSGDPDVLTIRSPVKSDHARWGRSTRQGLLAASELAVAAEAGGLTVRLTIAFGRLRLHEVQGVLALFLVLQDYFGQNPVTAHSVPIGSSIAAAHPGPDAHSLTSQLDHIFGVTGDSPRACIAALKELVNPKPSPPSGYQVEAPESPIGAFEFKHHKAVLDPETAIEWMNTILTLFRKGRRMLRNNIDHLITQDLDAAFASLLEDDNSRRRGSDNSRNNSDADSDDSDDSDDDSEGYSSPSSDDSHRGFVSETHVEIVEDEL